MELRGLTKQALLAENADLRARLEEARETLRAIRSGEVDALVVDCPEGPKIFTLQGLDAESNRLRGEMLAQVSDAVIATDRHQHVVYLNAAAERQYGVAAAEVLGKHLSEVFETRWPNPAAETAAMAELEATGNWRGANIHVKRDGKMIHVESAVARLRDTHGGMLAVVRDVSERWRADTLREGQNRVLEMVAADAPLGHILETLVQVIELQSDGMLGSVLLLDEAGRCVHHGAAGSLPPAYRQAIDGLPIGARAGSCGTALYRRELVIVSDIAADPLWDDYRAAALQHGLRACWSHPILAHDGEALGTFAMYYREPRRPSAAEKDLISFAAHLAAIAIERKRAASRLSHLAHHDPLTGVANRAQLEADLGEVLACAQRDGRMAAVMFIDLDRFKAVNDSFGHPVGDRLLQAVAKRLQHCLRSGDSVGRLGGDEFVICLPRVQNHDEVRLVAGKVLEALGRIYHVDGHDLQIGGSLGIAIYPTDGADAAMMLRAGDVAMYHAKSLGRNNYQFFTRGLDAAVERRQQLMQQLSRALPQRELMLRYQPQVDLGSGRMFGAEALLRWQHPDGMARLPADFIPLVEGNDLILAIGDWTLREACAELKRWHDAGRPDLRVAVNVSVHQLLQPGFGDTVEGILRDSRLPPAALDLEITESVLMHHSDENHATLARLHALGVHIMVDDFGTGYSNLAYLRGFPIDALKIDQSFVQGIGNNANDATIVDAIIAMARSLQMNVIAEGVETAAQAAFLQQRGCTAGQGYYYDQPLTADALLERLAA